MNSTRAPAALALLARFDEFGPRTRWHVRGRWWTCPFPAVAEALPTSAREVLDVGCGHGLFSLFLAAGGNRRVRGIDLADHKLGVARRAAAVSPPLAVTFSSEVNAHGPFDAAVVIDVLYLLSPTDQEAVVRRLAAQVAPGGALLVKEMSSRPRRKVWVLRAQEAIATRLLRITARSTRRLTFTAPETLGQWMTEAGLAVQHHDLSRGFQVPHHLVAGLRTGSADPTTP